MLSHLVQSDTDKNVYRSCQLTQILNQEIEKRQSGISTVIILRILKKLSKGVPKKPKKTSQFFKNNSKNTYVTDSIYCESIISGKDVFLEVPKIMKQLTFDILIHNVLKWSDTL